MRNLLALRNRVGGDIADTAIAVVYIFSCLDEPCGDKIERPTALAEFSNPAHLLALHIGLVFRTDKGQVAEDERAIARRQQIGPIGFQRVAVDDVGRLLKRNANEGLTELKAQPVVHDVIHHPQRSLGDPRHKLA